MTKTQTKTKRTSPAITWAQLERLNRKFELHGYDENIAVSIGG